MALRDDTRGQSIGISRFFLSVFVVGALVFWIVDELGTPMLTGAQNETANATANQASTWLLDFLDLMPILMLFIALIGSIILAIYRREVTR